MRKSVRMAENDIKLRNIYLRFEGGILDFKGVSMEPTFRDGDKVKIEPVEAKDIKIGDIVIFERDILVCHRILGRFRQGGKIYFWEKGDNSGCIGYISEDDIIGKAAYLIERDMVKNPDPYLSRQSVTTLSFLQTVMCPYIKTAGLIKRYIFFGKKNLFSDILGTLVRKMHYFCFGIITRKKY
jgi:signal peptidase I